MSGFKDAFASFHNKKVGFGGSSYTLTEIHDTYVTLSSSTPGEHGTNHTVYVPYSGIAYVEKTEPHDSPTVSLTIHSS
jgi:hypothetical protein